MFPPQEQLSRLPPSADRTSFTEGKWPEPAITAWSSLSDNKTPGTILFVGPGSPIDIYLEDISWWSQPSLCTNRGLPYRLGFECRALGCHTSNTEIYCFHWLNRTTGLLCFWHSTMPTTGYEAAAYARGRRRRGSETFAPHWASNARGYLLVVLRFHGGVG